jgi:hypothetical protein
MFWIADVLEYIENWPVNDDGRADQEFGWHLRSGNQVRAIERATRSDQPVCVIDRPVHS